MDLLGWFQLKHQKVRLLVAVSGIAFAVILILMQLGFRSSLYESALRYQQLLRYDIALISTESHYIARTTPFSIRRLYQARGFEGVESVAPLYTQVAIWKNPWTHVARNVLAVGADPADDVLDVPGLRENLTRVQRRDAVLFDARSRPEHGPVGERFRAGEAIATEVNDRHVEVAGVYELGTSFGIDGNLFTSEDNFLRLFPHRARNLIDVGLVRLLPGTDAEKVRDAMRATLPLDVLVLTKPDYIARERAYWSATTPIGAVFSFGVVIGIVVGAIIVYQILFADVSDHLPEYATLKAMGYSNRYLSWVVLQQAVILGVLGFLPGLTVSWWLYGLVGNATHLPMILRPDRLGSVLVLTVVMCSISGLLALRKVRSLDPAEIF